MCIACLSDRYLRFDYLGEYVFLSIEEKRLRCREVYDMFFQVVEDWPDAKLMCVSPHDLLGDGRLGVSVIENPGNDALNDIAYSFGAAHGMKIDPQMGVLSAWIARDRHFFQPAVDTYEGNILKAAATLPEEIAQDKVALDVMSQCGSVFCLSLGNLRSNTPYALRLEITPAYLLGLEMPRDSTQIDSGLLRGRVVQAASVYCPKTSLLNLKALLERSAEVASSASGAANILALVDQGDLRLVSTNRHRIVVICPPEASIESEPPPGCIMPVGVYSLPGSSGRLAAEWAGGAEMYWTDDIESFADRIWNYLVEWASQEPKSKEAITAALNAPHENCSTIVDLLASPEVGLIREVPGQPGHYQAVRLQGEANRRAFETVATSSQVAQHFRWMGYVINYSISYRHASANVQKLLKWERFKIHSAFWIAIISLLLTIIGLVLTLALS